ncbi:MAG: L-threonylcarbamoyladenylate synthase [Gammaproteobacteria bacterium]
MSNAAIEQAVHHLRQGHVIAYPTEAVWGFGCDPFDEKAVHKILAIKQREVDKGLLLVAANREQVEPLLAPLASEQIGQLEATWPGPVTWLIPDPEPLFPAWIRGQHTSVAIRVSSHPVVHALCTAFGGPIVSTSANQTNEPELRSEQDVRQRFGDALDFIVTGEIGQESDPSQIRDLMTGAIIR